ncbi:invasin domain 3-containing protein [Paenibacillus tyrfis]|uniref:invasin domain 3-containing protein n=1 Tax=Paenibacillus tyrfis TaxID=1501230 RepID=UPI00209CF365|nr:invasin domain 3-containing protein [Paenibacillus tyrfis]MCP1311371.1 Ig-like domain-containing protein [Paenibacillus tyrfis]
MEGMNQIKRWIAIVLIFMLTLGLAPGGKGFAAEQPVLDQEQAIGIGNVFVNRDYPRYQTFTPAISGNLNKIELNIFDFYNGTGALRLGIYKEGDLGTPLATEELTSYSPGWVAFDFSGVSPYLKKDTMYRMVASTENGGSGAGFGWYTSPGDPYKRGNSPSPGYDFSFRTYMIPDYSISPGESEVSSAQSSLAADGTSQTTVTVKLKDAQGNAWPTGGSAVTITSTLGTVSAVTDNYDGTYTATLTAPTTLGTATISAMVGGIPIAKTASVQFVPGAPSTSTSMVVVGSGSLPADGTSQTTVNVKLKDARGHALTSGGATVAITSMLGTVSAVTDNQNGTYTATLTAPTTLGTATISATVGGSPIASTASVQFVPGAPSAATSAVEAGSSSLTADGASQTTISVKLKDAQGHALTSGGAAVAITSTLGTVSAVADNQNGTYTATLTAPTTVGTATISASVGGSAIASTASVQFVPGAPSAATSTVEAGNASLTADGASQTTISVKLKDAKGNALTSGGAAVVITSTLGTVGAVTDNQNGTYTAMLTAPTIVGTATISATVGGSAIALTASVQFEPGAPSTATSTVEAGAATLAADGASQTTISVKLKDAQGNALASGGAAVAITSTLGTVSAVTDKQNGTYTATLTAPTTVGTATISATVGGSAIASTASVQFVPGAPSAATSTVEAGSVTLGADGTSQTTISVKLKDAQGHALTSGGAAVAITSTLGTVSAVTDKQNGTYTATLTAPTTVGTTTISATVGGSAIASTVSVQFVPGAPSAATSTVEAGNASLTADGASQTTVSVKLKDAQGNALTSGGAAVAITSTLGTIGAVTDKQNGTYTATLTAPTTVGTATISATVGGSAIASTASVQFMPGAPSAATSTVEAANASLTADGASQTTISVKLKDAQGHALTNGGAAVAITSTLGTVGAVTDNQNGTYTATLTAPTTVGTATISATFGGAAMAQTASVQFLHGQVSVSRSTVAASDLVVRADGNSKASIFVRLKDDYDHSLAGKRVMLQATGGRSVIQQVYGLTDQEGLVTFAVSNTAAENVTYFAKDEASGLVLDQTVSITFTYDQPPNIKLQADPVAPTFGNVTVTVSASVYGQFNRVSSIKWAAGSRAVSYFDKQGTEIADHRFTVQENGMYSVYVADTAGNANVSLIEVKNIVPRSGNADLAGWQLAGLGGTVKFDFNPGVTSYTVDVSHAVYGLKMTLTPSDVYSAVYVNGSQVTGNAMPHEYSLVTGKNTFEVKVKAQNGSIKTYTLSVIRSAASTDSGSGGSDSGSDSDSSSTSPSSAANPPSQPAPTNSLAIWIHDQKVSGIATLQVDADGAKSVEVVLDANTLKKVLDSLSAAAKTNLAISIEDEAGKVALRLPGKAVTLLAEKADGLTLKTRQGQYRLPLAELTRQEFDWTNDAEVQLTIELGKSKAISGLQDAANKGGFQLAADPVHFTVQVVRHGERREISGFSRYVERVLYLPKDFTGKASTVVVWDGKLGARPVPTKFTKVDGRQAAVIHSLTNSAYVPVSRTSKLTDIQGHWAAAEIGSMNSRMIVDGVDESRFVPEAEITRAELAALLARAMGLPKAGDQAGFQDVSETSWYSGAVAAVKAYGIMDGFGDGTFGPDRKVSRQEAIVTLVRALRLADADSAASHRAGQADLTAYADRDQIGGWASDAIRTAIHAGLVNGYGDELRPQKTLTRAETAVLLYRMLLQAGFIDG